MQELFDRFKGKDEMVPTSETPIGEINTPYQEIDGSKSFDENQRATLAIHKEELPDLVQNPSVIIVKRAYKELSNGNLTAQLDAWGDLQVNGDDIESIIVVNNPRIMAVLANLGSQIANQDSVQIARLVRAHYSQLKVPLSEDEEKFLDQVEKGQKKPDKVIAAYKENQVSLAILRAISETVVKIKKQVLDEANALEQLDILLKQLTKGFLDEDQLSLLLKAAGKILRKKIIVLGIDCSSENKAYKKVDLGQATNQGGHIAVARGAQYIDISDMDEFNSPSSLNEIISLARTKKPDVLYRPLKIVNPQHPEQLKNSGWKGLVYYYGSSALRREHEWKYAHYKPEEDYEAVHNTGHIVVSNKAFRKHQYPHNDWFEDLYFSRRLQTDRDLTQYQLLDSDLLLADRGREESYDGSKYNKDIIPQDVRTKIEERSLDLITTWIERDKEIRQFLQRETAFQHLLRYYENAKAAFIRLENKERRSFRFIVLSKEGLIYKLFGLLSGSEELIDSSLERADLTPVQRVFLKSNPALLPALRQEVRLQNMTNLEQICQFVEQSLPELFYPPISYAEVNPDLLEGINLNEALKTRGLANISLWIHLYKSRQRLASIVANENTAAVYPNSQKEKVDKLLKLLTQ